MRTRQLETTSFKPLCLLGSWHSTTGSKIEKNSRKILFGSIYSIDLSETSFRGWKVIKILTQSSAGTETAKIIFKPKPVSLLSGKFLELVTRNVSFYSLYKSRGPKVVALSFSPRLLVWWSRYGTLWVGCIQWRNFDRLWQNGNCIQSTRTQELTRPLPHSSRWRRSSKGRVRQK